jgi:MtN3 and saliva related transmembrane protein
MLYKPMPSGIDNVSALGFVAGALTTFAFFAQVLKTLRTKSTRDISLAMVTLTSTGIFLWFIYGLYVGSMPIIVVNLISFILTLALVVLKLKYR